MNNILIGILALVAIVLMIRGAIRVRNFFTGIGQAIDDYISGQD